VLSFVVVIVSTLTTAVAILPLALPTVQAT
jgi:hypothetical protein